MSVFVTGDTHGCTSHTKKLYTRPFSQTGKNFTKDDAVIILGDFGWCFSATKDGKETKDEHAGLKQLDRQKWTTLFVDGNHENFDRLYAYEEGFRFGGKVGVLRPSVFHLKERGHIYEIDGHKCFVFGGAFSTDKASRTEGVTWWPQEMPTRQEYDRGLDEMEKANWKVDYILTHEAPFEIGKRIQGEYIKKDALSEYLNEIAKRADFKAWYFGHHHVNKHFCVENKNYVALFEDIIPIDSQSDEIVKTMKSV